MPAGDGDTNDGAEDGCANYARDGVASFYWSGGHFRRGSIGCNLTWFVLEPRGGGGRELAGKAGRLLSIYKEAASKAREATYRLSSSSLKRKGRTWICSLRTASSSLGLIPRTLAMVAGTCWLDTGVLMVFCSMPSRETSRAT